MVGFSFSVVMLFVQEGEPSVRLQQSNADRLLILLSAAWKLSDREISTQNMRFAAGARWTSSA